MSSSDIFRDHLDLAPDVDWHDDVLDNLQVVFPLRNLSDTLQPADSLFLVRDCVCQFSEMFGFFLQGKFRFEEMGLPSFRPIYLFLVRIPLDVVHECLKLRLEQQPEEPSMLSVKQVRKNQFRHSEK